MIKSLYVRVVLTFLGAVILSIFTASLLINHIYIGQIKKALQDHMISSGKMMIKAYEQAEGGDLDYLMTGVSSLPGYAVHMYDSKGKLLYVSSEVHQRQLELEAVHVPEVLHGGVFRSGINKGEGGMTVGLPLTVNGSPGALFITPEVNELVSMIGGFLKTQLLFILGFGSLFILIAARYIVQPLRRLTRATRRMAKGDFSVSLSTKRGDEIGQLTQSFNVMAKELGTLEESRKRFVSDVSHEIQSPLTSIKGFTQALKYKQLDEQTRMRLLDIIEAESDRLSRLSGDLLQLSTLEYEHMQLSPGKFSLDEQLRQVVIALEPQWSTKEMTVNLDVLPVTIEADEDRLSQIWSNLLSNSIKHTNNGGTIDIKVSLSGEQVLVEIADTGSGIPEEELHHIFKPFYKVDKSRERKVGGSGLGLSIVKRIVDLHKGQIEVASTPGKGTTVSVQLPQFYYKPEL
ncbi:ATP-binding protein [Paenibacillus sp. NPDC056722]|uniref:HAMP domain-containing sensor histidine kinase n=1 Tax=Paenibacillus sp. NPDC056722 TaxID=3345924 RepID=UPI00367AF660